MSAEKTEEEKFYEAYKMTLQARNFHYEQFTKWANFFYVTNGALLFAYCNLKDSKLSLVLSFFGIVLSFLGYLSCKGNYFWINNWAAQIYRLEKRMKKEHRIHSIFSLETNAKYDSILNPIGPANISTSKITLLLFFIICSIWAGAAIRDITNLLEFSDYVVAVPFRILFVIPKLLIQLFIILPSAPFIVYGLIRLAAHYQEHIKSALIDEENKQIFIECFKNNGDVVL